MRIDDVIEGKKKERKAKVLAIQRMSRGEKMSVKNGIWGNLTLDIVFFFEFKSFRR